ncbi:MAG TPA: YaaR family protein [Clostridiaceae bacterium]|nr:YaaR family protein [Clostridiaceae bacterium]
MGLIFLKISDALKNPSVISEVHGKDEKRVAEAGETSFRSQLKRIENGNHEERLRHLVSQITEQGEKLGKKIDIRELRIYKKLIAEFLDEALNNSRRFTKQNFLDRRGRHRIYAVVKKINDELELLTQDILKTEKDNIAILKRIDDIRGLIMDIFM